MQHRLLSNEGVDARFAESGRHSISDRTPSAFLHPDLMHTEGSVRVCAFADIPVSEIDACAVVGGAQPVGIHHRRVELKPRKCQIFSCRKALMRRVAAQAFELLALMRATTHCGVQTKAVRIGAQGGGVFYPGRLRFAGSALSVRRAAPARCDRCISASWHLARLRLRGNTSHAESHADARS